MKTLLNAASLFLAATLLALAAAPAAHAQSMFTHQIPLKLPKGAGGMQPDLALTYVPGSGNGIVGVGWQLTGFSHITRVNYGNGISYSGSDTYVHSILGVLVKQSDGSYRSKRESFTKLVPSGTCGDGPCSWLAYDRSGMRYYYGGTTGSNLLGVGASVRLWALTKVVDLFGNYYEVSYTNTLLGNTRPTYSGQLLPGVVTYTRGPGLSVVRTVEFAYESRYDMDPGYYQGVWEWAAGRLKWITIKSAGALLRQYRLDYQCGSSSSDAPCSGSITGRSRLTSVTEYGSDGVSTLPAQTFAWPTGADGFIQEPWSVLNNWGGRAWTFAGDFNGDGKTDIASGYYGSVYMKLSTGSGFTSQTWLVPNNWGGAGYNWAGDFDGDGKADIASAYGTSVYVKRSTGNGFTQGPAWSAPYGFGGADYTWVGDFNGDGKTDIASAYGTRVYVYLSTGSGFDAGIWSAPYGFGGSGYTWVGDFNGDGKADIASANGGNIYVYLSTGNGFDPKIWTVPNEWGSAANTWVGDFNGDGKTDVATYVLGSTVGNFRLLRSTGTSFAASGGVRACPAPPPGQPPPPCGLGLWARPPGFVGDFNGAGKAEIATVGQHTHQECTTYCDETGCYGDCSDVVDGTSIDVYRLDPSDYTGVSPLPFVRSSYYVSADVTGGWLFPGDFDGNGLTDIASAIGGTVWMQRPAATMPDLIRGLANGLGGIVSVDYAPAPQVSGAIVPTSAQPGIPNTSPQPLVTRVLSSDGRGGFYWTGYAYSDGRVLMGKIPDRRNLGFASITTTDDQTGQYKRTYFSQVQGKEGQAIQVDSAIRDGRLVKRETKSYEVLYLYGGPQPTELVRELQDTVQTYELGTLAFTQTTTTTSYDDFGNPLVKTQSADGLPTVTVTTEYANDPVNWILGRIRTITTTTGGPWLARVENTWDNNNRLTAKSEWLDTIQGMVTTTMTYDANGNVATVTAPWTGDGNNRVTTTEYDASFRAYPVKVTNALGHVTQRAYNADGLVVSFTDANGQTTTTSYDVFGRKVLETRLSDGGTTRWSYVGYGSASGQYNETFTRVDATRSLWTREFFDGMGFKYLVWRNGDCGTQTIIVDGRQYHYAVVESLKDLAGRPYKNSQPYCAAVPPQPVWTTNVYDDAGRPTYVQLPDGKAIEYRYGATYRAEIDQNGRETRKYIDARDRVTSVVDALTQTTSYGYDPLGRLTSVTLPLPDGSVTTTTYDTLNRKTSVTAPQLGTTIYGYDAVGNVTRVTVGSRVVNFTYDAINRVKTKEPVGEFTVISTYDEPAYAYSVGRLTTLLDASGVTHFSYKPTGQLNSYTKIASGRNFSQYFTYDLAGRVTQITYPDTSYASYAYTDGGNLSTLLLNGTNVATWSSYDADGKPWNVAYGNLVSTSYTFDAMGHMASLVTTKGTTTFQNLTYDWYNFPNTGGLNVGKITDNRGSKIVVDPRTGENVNTDETQTYTYDNLYRLRQAVGVWGTGGTATKPYDYTAIGTPTTFGGVITRTLVPNGQQVVSGTGLANVTYDADTGNMTHKELDGVTWDYTWTVEGRLAKACKNAAPNACQNGSAIPTAQMTYDADGGRVTKVYTPSSGPTVATTYIGQMYELRTYGDGSPERHTLNLFGNGQMVASVSKAGPIITASNSPNGWRTELAKASVYNGRNLVGAAKKAGHLASAVIAHPIARRWLGPALFAVVTMALVAAFVAAAVRRAHTRAVPLRLRLASLSVVLVFGASACSGGPGDPNAALRNPVLSGDTTYGPSLGTYYYHRNHINSSSVITDATGLESNASRIVYLPFGEISQANSVGVDSVTSKYTGKELDEETGLYYYGARYYDPAIGRFVSADPVVPKLLNAQSFNRYSYVNNNPIVYVDPTGHFLDFIGKAFRALARAIAAVVHAIEAAAKWLAQAAVAVARFLGNAANYAWQMTKAMFTNPLALVGFLVAAAISIATLNPGPLIVWAKATAAAIGAQSLAMAAGVRDPTVLALIGVAAGVLGAGSQVVDFLKSAGQIGMGKLLRVIGGEKLAAIGALAMLVIQNLAGDDSEGDARKSEGQEGKSEVQLAANDSGSGDSTGEKTATDAQIDYTVKVADRTPHSDITIGFDYAKASSLGKAWFWVTRVGAIVGGVLLIAAAVATGPVGLAAGLLLATQVSLGVFGIGWALGDIAATFTTGPRSYSLPRRRRRRGSTPKRAAFAAVP